MPTDAQQAANPTNRPDLNEILNSLLLAEQAIYATGSEIELRLRNYESISEATEILGNYSIPATKLTVYHSHDQYIWKPHETIWLENGELRSSQTRTKWTTDLPWRLRQILLSVPSIRIFGRSKATITTRLKTRLKWYLARMLPSRYTPQCLLGTPLIILEELTDLDLSKPGVSYQGYLPKRHILRYLDSMKTPGGISFTLIGCSVY